MKSGNNTPVLKKDGRTGKTNYWPSIIPNLSKVFERFNFERFRDCTLSIKYVGGGQQRGLQIFQNYSF